MVEEDSCLDALDALLALGDGPAGDGSAAAPGDGDSLLALGDGGAPVGGGSDEAVSPAEALRKIRRNSLESGRKVLAALRKRGLDPRTKRAKELLLPSDVAEEQAAMLPYSAFSSYKGGTEISARDLHCGVFQACVYDG